MERRGERFFRTKPFFVEAAGVEENAHFGDFWIQWFVDRSFLKKKKNRGEHFYHRCFGPLRGSRGPGAQGSRARCSHRLTADRLIISDPVPIAIGERFVQRRGPDVADCCRARPVAGGARRRHHDALEGNDTAATLESAPHEFESPQPRQRPSIRTSHSRPVKTLTQTMNFFARALSAPNTLAKESSGR